MSISALTSVVSARLTIDQLAYTTIDSLSQVSPSQLCIEAAYPAVAEFVSAEYGIGDLEAAGVTFGTVRSCAEAVISGELIAYVTDQPLLSWLAFQYYNTGNLYVSPTVRINPLTLAYQSGSTLRKLGDTAVIRLITDPTWISARDRLEDAWFQMGEVAGPSEISSVNVSTLVAAGVLTLTWLAAMLVVVSRKALRAVRTGHPLLRVSTMLRSGPTTQRGGGAGDGGAGEEEDGNGADTLPPRADRGKAPSPRIDTGDV